MTRPLILALVLASLALPALAQDITGVWLTSSGNAHIRIAKCGPALCGTIIWLREPNDAAGRPLTDAKNPDPARRALPMIGVEVAINFLPSRDEPGRYEGAFYNAEDGNTYRGSITPQGADTLRVEGCLLVFCQTQTWTRVGR